MRSGDLRCNVVCPLPPSSRPFAWTPSSIFRPPILSLAALLAAPVLAKDVEALANRMSEAGIDAPIIRNISNSNHQHADFCNSEIDRRLSPRSRVLLLGLSFKLETDDLRESPLVRIADYILDQWSPSHNLRSRFGWGNNRTDALLPTRLSSKLSSTLSASARWDLVIVGKHFPDISHLVNRYAPRLHIDQL